MRSIWHDLGHASIDCNIGWTLSQTHVVNADVHRTLTANRMGYRVRFAKVGDHDRRKHVSFPIQNLGAKSGSFEKSPADLGHWIDSSMALKCTGDPPAPDGMSESERWTGIHRQPDLKSFLDAHL